MSAWVAWRTADGQLHGFGDEQNRPQAFAAGTSIGDLLRLPRGEERWDPIGLQFVPGLVARPFPDIHVELSTIKTSLARKPDKRSTSTVDTILSKSDSLWTTADIATVLRWVVSVMREV